MVRARPPRASAFFAFSLFALPLACRGGGRVAESTQRGREHFTLTQPLPVPLVIVRGAPGDGSAPASPASPASPATAASSASPDTPQPPVGPDPNIDDPAALARCRAMAPGPPRELCLVHAHVPYLRPCAGCTPAARCVPTIPPPWRACARDGDCVELPVADGAGPCVPPTVAVNRASAALVAGVLESAHCQLPQGAGAPSTVVSCDRSPVRCSRGFCVEP